MKKFSDMRLLLFFLLNRKTSLFLEPNSKTKKNRPIIPKETMNTSFFLGAFLTK